MGTRQLSTKLRCQPGLVEPWAETRHFACSMSLHWLVDARLAASVLNKGSLWEACRLHAVPKCASALAWAGLVVTALRLARVGGCIQCLAGQCRLVGGRGRTQASMALCWL